MTSSNDSGPPPRWHIAPWPPLAWLETVIKLGALATGITACINGLTTGDFALPDGLRLAQWIVLVVLSLGLIAAIFDRFIEREIVAMAFVIVNNAGHWGMVIALLSGAETGRALVAFAALMLAGDLVKLVFIWRHQYAVRDVPRRVVYGLTLAYAAGYGAILLLELAR